MGAALCCGKSLGDDDGYEKLADVVRFDEGPESVTIAGSSVSGEGALLANAPIMQTKAYFEVRLKKMGKFGIGIATSKLDQSKTLGDDENGWGLTSDACVKHNGVASHSFDDLVFSEGGIVGVSFDQTDLTVLNYYYNGKNLGCLVISVKGNVYPSVSVSDGASVEVNFGGAIDFAFPMGFEGVMCERTLI